MVSGGSRESVVVRVDLDELAGHWTLLDDERGMVRGQARAYESRLRLDR